MATPWHTTESVLFSSILAFLDRSPEVQIIGLKSGFVSYSQPTFGPNFIKFIK